VLELLGDAEADADAEVVDVEVVFRPQYVAA